MCFSKRIPIFAALGLKVLLCTLFLKPIISQAQVVIRDSLTNMELVFVKGGCYQMGDNFGDGEPDETPVHKVCVGDFYMGKYEVTQEEWVKVMGENPSAFKYGHRYPVEWVSWEDANLFLEKLNVQSHKEYRLPTEAEWEFACRSRGSLVKYGTATGNLTPDQANYGSGNWGEGNVADGYEFTSPVGSFPPNSLGLYDMTGNLFEWVSDWKDMNESYYSESPVENPTGIKKSVRKVGRGGAWNFGPDHQRCSNRFSNWSNFNCVSYGFRVVLSVTDKNQ